MQYHHTYNVFYKLLPVPFAVTAYTFPQPLVIHYLRNQQWIINHPATYLGCID